MEEKKISEVGSFKEKLTKYLNEAWEQHYNPTLKDIENYLVKQESQKIELKDALATKFMKDKIKFIYDDIDKVYRVSKIKFSKGLIFLIVSVFCGILFWVTFFYPTSGLNRFYWGLVLLLPIFFSRFYFIFKKDKKRKILVALNIRNISTKVNFWGISRAASKGKKASE